MRIMCLQVDITAVLSLYPNYSLPFSTENSGTQREKLKRSSESLRFHQRCEVTGCVTAKF